jgi:hypothetical protein
VSEFFLADRTDSILFGNFPVHQLPHLGH